METKILRSGRFGGGRRQAFYFLLDFIFILFTFLREFAGGQRRLVSKLYSALAVGIYFFLSGAGRISLFNLATEVKQV